MPVRWVLCSDVLGGRAQWAVIAYFSHSLSWSERNYCVIHQELLAVILGICQFRADLYGRRFLLHIDHASLTWLLYFRGPADLVAWDSTVLWLRFDTELVDSRPTQTSCPGSRVRRGSVGIANTERFEMQRFWSEEKPYSSSSLQQSLCISLTLNKVAQHH